MQHNFLLLFGEEPQRKTEAFGRLVRDCDPQFWQLYNAITLFELSRHKECKEWQVFVLALTFLVLFLGNFLTTLKVVHTKFQKNKLKKL